MSLQQTFEGSWLREEVANRGYAEFEHGIHSEEIETLVSRYANFTLSLPDPNPATMDAMLPAEPDTADTLNPEYHTEDGKFSHELWLSSQLDNLSRDADEQTEWHKYRTNIPGVGKPNGYTNRSFQVSALARARDIRLEDDPKEFYHYTPRHYAGMARQHAEMGWGAIPPEVTALDTAFSTIHQKASRLITKVCSLVEETHPEINQIVTRESLLTSPVRLLFYHPSDSEQLGAGHYDKSILTLQLAESHEGLRVASANDAPLEPVVRDAEKAVFFPGRSLREKTEPHTPFQPGWHDIIRVNKLNHGRNVPPIAIEVCARWALIFFTNEAHYTDPGKAATHQR